MGRKKLELPFRREGIQEHTLAFAFISESFCLLISSSVPPMMCTGNRNSFVPPAVAVNSSRRKKSHYAPVNDPLCAALWKHAKGNVALECNVSFLFHVLHNYCLYHHTDDIHSLDIQKFHRIFGLISLVATKLSCQVSFNLINISLHSFFKIQNMQLLTARGITALNLRVSFYMHLTEN